MLALSTSPLIDQYLAQLNSEQMAVANVGAGQHAVLGNPGSGKTRANIARIARLVRDGFPPQYILAMTFTKAAAEEMTKRLDQLGIKNAKVGTIHSLSRQLLVAGGCLRGGLKLETLGDPVILLRDVMTKLRKQNSVPRGRVNMENIASFIDDCKASGPTFIAGDPFKLNGKGLVHVQKQASAWSQQAKVPPAGLLKIYLELEKTRAEKNIWDFQDMQGWAFHYLAAGNWKKWRSVWSVIIVDEAQDSSIIQWDMARLLVGLPSIVLDIDGDDSEHNLMVLGQAEQSIYGWRSASPQDFIDYAHDEDTQVHQLLTNYRSVPQICKVANGLVQGEEWAITDPMAAHRSDPGEPRIHLYPFDSPFDESIWAVRKAKELADGRLKNVTILSRMGSACGLLELQCLKEQIPYVKWAQGTFLESKAVLDIMSYMKVASLMDSDGKELRRAINAPFRYIGKQALNKAFSAGLGMGSDGLAPLDRLIDDRGLAPRQRGQMEKLADFLSKLQKDTREGVNPQQALLRVVKDTDYLDASRDDASMLGSAELRPEDVTSEIYRIAGATKTVPELVQLIEQMRQSVKAGKRRLQRKHLDQKDYLILSTIHSYKGLESKHIILTDMVAGRFPCDRSDPDEELRLMYVALTRAMDSFHGSFTRPVEGQARSSFVDDVALLASLQKRTLE